MDDLHGAAAEHVGRAHHQREADLGGDEAGLFHRIGDAVVRLVEVKRFMRSFWKRSRSSARSIVSGAVPRIGMPAFSKRFGELQRRLAAELDDDANQLAVFLLGLQDLDHVLSGQRLEIKPVRGVVVGRDGFRVAVDHDRLVAGIAAARRRRGSSNSRTRCPGRYGSARRRG